MKLSPELNEILCQQIINEYQNSLSYKQIEAWFEQHNLHNIAKYFGKQAKEENCHANKIIEYINHRNGGVLNLDEINTPKLIIVDVRSVADAYNILEQSTTESIEGIYKFAFEQGSFMDLPFISHMLKIQVDEEAEAMEFGTGLTNTKDLILFDQHLR